MVSTNERACPHALSRLAVRTAPLAGLPRNHGPQHRAKRKISEDGMPERSLQVDGVVMPAAVPTYVEHAGSPEVADKAPNGPLRQRHFVGDLPDRALRVYSYEEENGAVARYKIPMVLNAAIGAVQRRLLVPRILIHVA